MEFLAHLSRRFMKQDPRFCHVPGSRELFDFREKKVLVCFCALIEMDHLALGHQVTMQTKQCLVRGFCQTHKIIRVVWPSSNPPSGGRRMFKTEHETVQGSQVSAG